MPPMHDRDRDYIGGTEAKSIIDRMCCQHRFVPVRTGRCKGISETLPNATDGWFITENGDGLLLQITKIAQIVDAVQVIGMGMRVEHGIYPDNTLP